MTTLIDEDKVKNYSASVCDFVNNNTGDTFNLLLGIVIFVVYGIVLTLTPYGTGFDAGAFDEKPHCGNDFAMVSPARPFVGRAMG